MGMIKELNARLNWFLPAGKSHQTNKPTRGPNHIKAIIEQHIASSS
jgi:hypothetical protein